jgi:hypothetical protein
MPAIEAIGLTLGILSVAGLFSTTLDAIDWFLAAGSYGEDYQQLVTKVSIERLRLFRWSQAVGHAPGSSQQHKLLQDADVHGAVWELLAWAVRFFGDVERVKRRHGVKGGGNRQGLIAFLLGRDRVPVFSSQLPLCRRSITSTPGIQQGRCKRMHRCSTSSMGILGEEEVRQATAGAGAYLVY